MIELKISRWARAKILMRREFPEFRIQFYGSAENIRGIFNALLFFPFSRGNAAWIGNRARCGGVMNISSSHL